MWFNEVHRVVLGWFVCELAEFFFCSFEIGQELFVVIFEFWHHVADARVCAVFVGPDVEFVGRELVLVVHVALLELLE